MELEGHRRTQNQNQRQKGSHPRDHQGGAADFLPPTAALYAFPPSSASPLLPLPACLPSRRPPLPILKPHLPGTPWRIPDPLLLCI